MLVNHQWDLVLRKRAHLLVELELVARDRESYKRLAQRNRLLREAGKADFLARIRRALSKALLVEFEVPRAETLLQ